MNIIGDIAGNLKTLQALLRKMPDEEFISLGDMVDRGPRSKEVMDFIRLHGKALLGNHEHIMMDYYNRSIPQPQGYQPFYRNSTWFDNGGLTTMESFSQGFTEKFLRGEKVDVSALIPQDYIEWLKTLPLFYQDDKLFLSHAPRHHRLNLAEAENLGKGFNSLWGDPRSDMSLIWNREDPEPVEGKIQIYGHNPYPDVLWHSADPVPGYADRAIGGIPPEEARKLNIYAVGIDTSFNKVLTGINFPTMEIYQQEYID